MNKPPLSFTIKVSGPGDLENNAPPKPQDWNTSWYDSTLTMVFAPPIFGCLDFIVIGTPRGSLTHVEMSYVYEPLEDFIRWLGDIAEGKLPAITKVDQEGSYAVFQALPVTDRPDWIELIINHDPDAKNPKYEDRMYWSRVERRQLVREFLRRFKDWLSNDYVAKEWHIYGKHDLYEDENPEACTNPHELDLAKLEIFAALPLSQKASLGNNTA